MAKTKRWQPLKDPTLRRRFGHHGYCAVWVKTDNVLKKEQGDYFVDPTVKCTCRKGFIPEWPEGVPCEVVSFYADTPVGKRGTVCKSWNTPANGQWVRLFFGKNLGGQRLTRAFPANVLKIISADETTSAPA